MKSTQMFESERESERERERLSAPQNRISVQIEKWRVVRAAVPVECK